MPSVDKHSELSDKRTGKSYRELHEWMDPWKDNEKAAIQRHDITNIPENILYVEKKWGEEGKKEFLHHIKEDHENKKGIILTILLFVKRKFFGWL